jgi:hypothetical protein
MENQQYNDKEDIMAGLEVMVNQLNEETELLNKFTFKDQ